MARTSMHQPADLLSWCMICHRAVGDPVWPLYKVRPSTESGLLQTTTASITRPPLHASPHVVDNVSLIIRHLTLDMGVSDLAHRDLPSSRPFWPPTSSPSSMRLETGLASGPPSRKQPLATAVSEGSVRRCSPLSYPAGVEICHHHHVESSCTTPSLTVPVSHDTRRSALLYESAPSSQHFQVARIKTPR